MKILKRTLSILLLLMLLSLSFVSCASLVQEEDKATVNGFIGALEAGDFSLLEGFMHPRRTGAELEQYFDDIEHIDRMDFQSGIEIIRYNNVSYSLYDSEVGGSKCELEMNVRVGDVQGEFSVEIVSNDDGFGIYDFEFDFD